MKRILGIWLPSWPIQRLVVDRPELRNQPVILFRRDPRRGQLVAACSPAARRIGVRSDMPLAEAKSLTRLTANGNRNTGQESQTPAVATIQLHDPAADLAALFKLTESCDQFSPIVGVEQAEQPSSIFLEATGLGHLFGSYENQAMLVAQHLKSLGYFAHVATAGSLAATWGITRFGNYQLFTEPRNRSANDSQTERAPAETTSDSAQPQHDFPIPLPIVVEPDDATAWQQLPVAALRLEPATLETLQQLGIQQIAELLQLPRTSLASRLGEQLLTRLDQLAGTIPEPIVAHHAAPEFEARQEIEFATRHRSTIDFIISQLTQQVSQTLTDQQRGALKIVCHFVCEHRQQATIRVGLFQPTAIATHLLELIRMQLEQFSLPAAVQSIAVQVCLSAPLVHQQRQLFEQSVQQDWQQLAQLVNRLSSRLGPEAVVRPVLQANAQPEYAVRYQKLTGQSQKSLKQAAKRSDRRKTNQQTRANKTREKVKSAAELSAASNATVAPFQRPLLLHPQPIELNTISIAKESNMADAHATEPNATEPNATELNTEPDVRSRSARSTTGPPAAFHYHDDSYQVASFIGPERIETGWWRAPVTQRDYYRIETSTGQRFWIFQNLRDRNWFVHGEF